MTLSWILNLIFLFLLQNDRQHSVSVVWPLVKHVRHCRNFCYKLTLNYVPNWFKRMPSRNKPPNLSLSLALNKGEERKKTKFPKQKLNYWTHLFVSPIITHHWAIFTCQVFGACQKFLGLAPRPCLVVSKKKRANQIWPTFLVIHLLFSGSFLCSLIPRKASGRALTVCWYWWLDPS